MSSNSNLKKQKAEHNLNVAKLLDSSKTDCSDWIVTISFYSTLHFVDYLLFPVKVQLTSGKVFTYKSIESLYTLYKSNKERPQSVHGFRARLVENYLDDYIHQYYDYLKTECFKARYQQYPTNNDTNLQLGAAKSILSAKRTDYNNLVINQSELTNI